MALGIMLHCVIWHLVLSRWVLWHGVLWYWVLCVIGCYGIRYYVTLSNMAWGNMAFSIMPQCVLWHWVFWLVVL